jgi:hypothetical protein
MKGVTAETDLGTVIVADAAGGCAAGGAYSLGILAEKHEFSKSGSALVAGAAHSAVIAGATGAAWFSPMGGNPDIFPSRLIEVMKNTCMCRIDYAKTGVAVTNSSGTTVTVGSLEDNIDTSFLYASAGEALGELRFVDTSAAGSCTTSNAFTTMTAAGYVVKILPLLHNLFVCTVGNTTTPTQLDTTAAVGTARIVQLERHIVRNGSDEIMDPYTHGNLSGLDHLSQLGFYGVFSIENTLFSPMA